MKQIPLILLLVIFAHGADGQIEADSMCIYTQTAYHQGFTRAGSTARLKSNHEYLDSTQVQKVKLSGQEMGEVKRIFQQANRKRFFQQKHAGDICYALVWCGGKRSRCIIEGNGSWRRLVNLDTMRKWTLNQPERIEDFQKIMDKNGL